MLKIRRPLGRLIFNMGIAIPGKTVFLIETAPSCFWGKSDSIPCLGPGIAPGSIFSGGLFCVSHEMTHFHSCLLCVGSWSFYGNHACAIIPSLLWITRSNFPWVLMALLVLLMTSAMIWHPEPHPTSSLVFVVMKFLRLPIPIEVWCWAPLFQYHSGAWSWVGSGLFGPKGQVCWLILQFHWGRWLLCCHWFLSSFWFPSCH